MTRTNERPSLRRSEALLERGQYLLREVFFYEVPRDHEVSDDAFRRRRWIVGIGLILGTTLLGLSLATAPGDPAFYPLTIGVAAVWIVAGRLSGRVHLGYERFRGKLQRPVVTPIVLGVLTSAVFVVGAVIIAQIEPLRQLVDHVLQHANQGNLALVYVVTLLNGAAEEVFFRGALYAAIGRRHAIVLSVLIYALVTVATGNPFLVFAALLMGTVFTFQRRATGGIMASTITHLIWSVAMLIALPAIISR